MFSLTNLCFLCLTNNKDLKNISAPDNDGVVVEEKLRYFLFELVNIKPDIPKHICYHCLKDLNHVYDFKQRCLRNIIKLNNYLHNLRTQRPNKNLKPTEPEVTNSSTTTENTLKENTIKENTINENTIKENTLNNVIVKRELDENCDKSEIEFVLLPETQKTHLKNEDEDVLPRPEDLAVEDIVVKVEPEDVPEEDEDIDAQDEDDEGMDLDDALQPTGNYKCPKCEKLFATKLNLRRHLRSHIDDKPYKCDYCSYETVRPFDLKYHMSKHTGDKPHKCDTCGYRCARPKDMRSHMRSHTGERPYQCDVCDKRFPHISNLKRHSQTHSTSKPYHCTYCSFKCSHADYLKVHVRQHTGDKQYQCDVCTKRFATNSHLLRHRRFHDDSLRPHKCFGCEKSFKLGSHLSKHIERAHTESHPCDKCGRVFGRSSELYRHKMQCGGNTD